MLQRQQEVLDIIEKLVKCFEDLLGKDRKTVLDTFQENKVITLIEEIEEYYKESQFQKIYLNAMAEVVSVKASAVRVMDLAQSDEVKMCKKLEFELLPLIENLRLNFYYHNWIGEDSDKQKYFLENEISYYYRNRYLEEAKRTGKYKYELSILVPAFNKLEITKQCIRSLKKYLPKDISYELIFFNNGSIDGTKEYFESQHPEKQLDIEINGGIGIGSMRILEGKYRLFISNDILVTENAISNMYKCIESDRKIGWVVPTTPNISNLQTIAAAYNSLEEMYLFAKRNNVSNPDRWEEKPRLCNPIDIIRIDDWFNLISKEILTQAGEGFPDDKYSYIFRRKGYKSILAKDAYCYHFGSATNRERNVQEARKKYCKGRIEFIKRLGIDPWGYGMGYDVSLMKVINIKEIVGENLLGINSGMGGNLLRMKALLKEYTDIKNPQITYVTQYDMNWEDVKGLGDRAYKVQNWTECGNRIEEKYDCILLENGVETFNIVEIGNLKQILSTKGILLVRTSEEYIFNIIKKTYNVKMLVEENNNFWIQIL